MYKQPQKIINKIMEFLLPKNIIDILYKYSSNNYLENIETIYNLSLTNNKYLQIINNLDQWKELEQYIEDIPMKMVGYGCDGPVKYKKFDLQLNSNTFNKCDNKIEFVYFMLIFFGNKYIRKYYFKEEDYKIKYIDLPQEDGDKLRQFFKNVLNLITRDENVEDLYKTILEEIKVVSLWMSRCGYAEIHSSTSIFNIGKYRFISRPSSYLEPMNFYNDWRIDIQKSGCNKIHELCNFEGAKGECVYLRDNHFNKKLFDEIFEYFGFNRNDITDDYYAAFIFLIGGLCDNKHHTFNLFLEGEYIHYSSTTILTPALFKKYQELVDDLDI